MASLTCARASHRPRTGPTSALADTYVTPSVHSVGSDCWAHRGASLDPADQCSISAQPETCSEGCCGGTFGQPYCCMNCWVASPQDVARTSTSRFESYVRSVVRRFKHDKRVLWWETFNEPTIEHSDYSDFSHALRSEAYKWAKAEAPDAPVVACWDDGNYTDVVDHHTYSGDMADLKQKATANPTKGGLVTESGCRWYRTYDRDAGSPLNVLNLLTAMRAERAAGEPGVPFVPGAMLAWELMVGNVNTRFQVRAPRPRTCRAVPVMHVPCRA